MPRLSALAKEAGGVIGECFLNGWGLDRVNLRLMRRMAVVWALTLVVFRILFRAFAWLYEGYVPTGTVTNIFAALT